MAEKSRLRRSISRWAEQRPTSTPASCARRTPRPALRPIAEAPDRERVAAPRHAAHRHAAPARRRPGARGRAVRRLRRRSPSSGSAAAGSPASRPAARSQVEGRIGVHDGAPDHVQPALRADPVTDATRRRRPPAASRRRPSRRSSAASWPRPSAAGAAWSRPRSRRSLFTVLWLTTARPAARADRQRRGRAWCCSWSGWCSARRVQFVLNALVGIGIGWLFVHAVRAAAAAATTTRRWPTSCPASSTTPATPCVLAFTCLIGWPLVGFMVGSVTGDPTAWHARPAGRAAVHAG